MARDSNARAADIIASAMDAIVAIDEAQRIIVFNGAAEKMFGHHASGILGKPVDLLIPERFRAEHKEHIRGFAATGETHRRPGRMGEIVGLRANGEEFPLEAAVSRTGAPPHRIFTAFLRDISERKRVEITQRAGELRLETVIASVVEGIISLDGELRIVLFNPAAERMFGRSMEEMEGQPLSILIPERFRARHDAHIRDFAATGHTNRAMGRYGLIHGLRANGKEFPIEATISQTGAAHNKLFTVILRDVTERKQMEDALRQSEQAFRAIFEQAAVGVAQVAPDGRWLQVNQKLCDITGYSREELLLLTFQAITYPDDLEADLAQVQRMLDSEIQTYTMEKRYIRKGGGLVWINLTVSLAREPSGVPLYFISVVEDITARKQVEQAQRESERRLQTLMDNLPGMVYRCLNDRNWTLVFVSDGCVALTGYRPSDFVETHVIHYAGLIHEDDREPVWDAVQLALAGNRPFELNYRIRTAAGEEKWVWERGQGVFSAGGELLCLEGFVTDVSARQQAEQSLRDYSERLRLLSHRLFEVEESERRRLARELHDRIGSNVTALGLNLNMVRAELPAAVLQKLGAHLNDCEGLLYSTAQLVRDVMVDLRPPGLDEMGLVAALNEHARQVSSRSGFSITVTGIEILPRLPPATEITLFRIAQEALTNIVKHAGATGVTLTVETDPDTVVLIIADNGRGFDTAARPASSLGMVSMRERAESVGGRLRVESSPGRGTRVIIEAPRANHASSSQPHLPGIEPVQDLGSWTPSKNNRQDEE